MRILIFSCLLSVLFSCGGTDCCVPPPKEEDKTLIKGVDISFLPEIEAAGTKFYNASGTEQDVLDILKARGVNTIRVRLWHTPSTTHSSLAEVRTFSERIKGKGFKLWLTVHYSDWWADPGQQVKPAAWATASFTDLSDSVYNYTKKITTLLNPDIIQIGNEINPGFLLPDGDEGNIINFTTLLKSGVQGVRDASPDAKIMIHYAGISGAVSFFWQLKGQSVDFDQIGISYYPIWHGKDLNVVKSTIDELGSSFKKEIIIAETAYPFTLGWNDYTNNLVGQSDQLIPAYPATPEGQRNFLLALMSIVESSPRGMGVAWWAPEWVAFKGPTATDGSSAENLTLFDFDNKALPALEAFEGQE